MIRAGSAPSAGSGVVVTGGAHDGPADPRPTARRRLGALLAAAGVLAGLMASRPALIPGDAPVTALRIRMDTAGFRPSAFRVRAGEPVVLTLANEDNPFRSGGGGYHSFVIESLGVRKVLEPLSVRTLQLAVPEPGRYEFFCDVRHDRTSGKAMRGVLVAE